MLFYLGQRLARIVRPRCHDALGEAGSSLLSGLRVLGVSIPHVAVAQECPTAHAPNHLPSELAHHATGFVHVFAPDGLKVGENEAHYFLGLGVDIERWGEVVLYLGGKGHAPPFWF